MKNERWNKRLKWCFELLKSRKRIFSKKPFPVKPGSIRSRKKDEDLFKIAELYLKLVLGSVNQADLVAIEDSSVKVDQGLRT